MSYWRPVKLQPPRLEVAASQSWTRSVVSVLARHRHTFSSHLCLRTIRTQLEDYLRGRVPAQVEESLFQAGLELVRRESGGEVGELGPATPDLLLLYLFVLYRGSIKSLDIPSLRAHADRVTVLDLLYNVGAQHGHQLHTVKIKMFDSPNISIEENYLTKRVLRGFHDVTTLVLWRAADDAMLQIIGHTCHRLEVLDLWRCVKVTDAGVRMMLGRDSEARTKLCSSLQRVIIKDTAVTDEGAFALVSTCPGLQSLEFSHGAFIKQFLERVEESFASTGTTHPLTSIFLPLSSPHSLHNLVRAFPRLEELSLWTSLSHLPRLDRADLAHVDTLKIGGLGYSSLLTQLTGLIGDQLVSLKIETVHFDINIDILAFYCPNLEELSVINARLCVTHPSDKPHRPPAPPPAQLFPQLRKLYLFLVSYTAQQLPEAGAASVSDPARVRRPATGVTALHAVLGWATRLETVTVTGTTALTDACLAAILATNPLSSLRSLVISVPSSQDPLLVIPLTLVSVLALAQSCPQLQCVGDLRHWAISPAHRRDISALAAPAPSSAQLQQTIWTRLRISAADTSRGRSKTSSVCHQSFVTA